MTEQPAERPKRRRIVTWSVVSGLATVLLLIDYFTLYCVWCWDGGNAAPTLSQALPVQLFIPAHRYVESDGVGSDGLFTIAIWSRLQGRWTWHECHAYMRDIKHDEPLYTSHPQAIAREASKPIPVSSPSTAPSPTP
jgi:hypothetical protein